MALTPKTVWHDSLYDNQPGYPENFSRGSRLTNRFPASNEPVHSQFFTAGNVDPALQGARRETKKFKLTTADPSVASRSRLARLIEP